MVRKIGKKTNKEKNLMKQYLVNLSVVITETKLILFLSTHFISLLSDILQTTQKYAKQSLHEFQMNGNDGDNSEFQALNI